MRIYYDSYTFYNIKIMHVQNRLLTQIIFLSNKSEIVTMIKFLIFLYCASSHATCIIRGYKHVACGFMAFIY